MRSCVCMLGGSVTDRRYHTPACTPQWAGGGSFGLVLGHLEEPRGGGLHQTKVLAGFCADMLHVVTPLGDKHLVSMALSSDNPVV